MCQKLTINEPVVSAMLVCGVFDSMVLETAVIKCSLLSINGRLAALRDLRNATTLGSDKHTDLRLK